MIINIKYLGDELAVMVHRLGGIMPYRVYGENTALDIVKETSELLKPLSKTVEVSMRRGSHR